jgi:hypothetical protein
MTTGVNPSMRTLDYYPRLVVKTTRLLVQNLENTILDCQDYRGHHHHFVVDLDFGVEETKASIWDQEDMEPHESTKTGDTRPPLLSCWGRT